MNAGKIIKFISIVFFFLISIGLIIAGNYFIQMAEGNRSIILIALIIGSIIVSTLITIFAYGFGDLVDTNRQILKRMNSQQ